MDDVFWLKPELKITAIVEMSILPLCILLKYLEVKDVQLLYLFILNLLKPV